MSPDAPAGPRAAAVQLLNALRLDRADCLDQARDYDGDDGGWRRTIGACGAVVLCARCWEAASEHRCVVGDAIGRASVAALQAAPDSAALDDVLDMRLALPAALLAPKMERSSR